jgi:hypothetical protein
MTDSSSGNGSRPGMTNDPARDEEPIPWPQRALDNFWVLLALSVLIPGLMYLAWGLWELVDLPTWGGG